MLTIFIIAGLWVGGLNAACDLSALQACDKNQASLSTLISWAAINTTTLEGFTYTFVVSSCSVWQSYLGCTKTAAVDTCANDPNAATFNKIRELTALYCNEEFLCLYNATVCAWKEIELTMALKTWEQTGVAPISKCPATARMDTCLNTASAICRIAEKSSNDLSKATDFLTRKCKENECTVLTDCKNAYNNGMSPNTPFNATICMRWKDYVNCSGGALSSCAGISPASGTPSTTEIAAMSNEYCTMLSDAALYNCTAFQECVAKYLPVLEVILSPNSFCMVAQIMTGCAAYSASNASCKVVNATSFIDRANKMALKGTGLGCGNPYVYIGNCASLGVCNTALSTVVNNNNSNFVQKCSAIYAYQSCASSATVSCGLTLPADAREPGPQLDALSSISKTVCDAMTGQSVSTCSKFLACMANGDQIPSEPGERPVGRAWCPIMRRVLECVLFLEDQCPISATLKTTLGTAYKNLTTAGCPDVYQYQTRKAPTPITAAVPTGEFQCLINSTTCALQELKLTMAFNEWTQKNVEPNTTYCPDVTKMNNCLNTESALCRIMEKNTAELAQATDYLNRKCKENDCNALTACKTTYNNGLSDNTPFNETTCTRWKDYVNCSGGAISSCAGISPASGTPSTTEIAASANEYCKMLSDAALYNCNAFQDCVNTYLSVNILSPNLFCQVAQIMTSCAAYSASNASCKVVNATSFIDRANKLALKGTGLGCGNPYVYIGNCASLGVCNTALSTVVDNNNNNFVQKCSALYAYQSCAYTATVSCGLTLPADAREPGPRLDTLSSISKRVCDAMTGQSVSTCSKFLECMAKGDKIPSHPGERPVGRAWCPIMRRVLECVLFFEDQCPISAALKTTLGTEYKNLITAGCPDVYQYQKRATATGGASSNSALAISAYLLLLSSAFTLLQG